MHLPYTIPHAASLNSKNDLRIQGENLFYFGNYLCQSDYVIELATPQI